MSPRNPSRGSRLKALKHVALINCFKESFNTLIVKSSILIFGAKMLLVIITPHSKTPEAALGLSVIASEKLVSIILVCEVPNLFNR